MLDTIVAQTRADLAARPQALFYKTVCQPKASLICEVKLKSPTHPQPFTNNPQRLFNTYKAAGVNAISVVTNGPFFGGSTHLVTQATATGLPVLRKDFIVEPRQINEVHTDALLLITSIVSPQLLAQLVDICRQLDIEPVVEVNSEADLTSALSTRARVIAVNSRNLQSQVINIPAAISLMQKIPPTHKRLFFSGITSPQDITRIQACRPNGLLIGTSVLTSHNRQQLITSFKGAL